MLLSGSADMGLDQYFCDHGDINSFLIKSIIPWKFKHFYLLDETM